MKHIEKLPYWVRGLVVVTFALVALPFIISSKQPEYNPMIKFYNLTQQIQTPRKMLFDRVAITQAAGQSIDISSAGFTNVTNVVLTGENNTTTIGNMPICIKQTTSTTAVTFNTVVGNTAVLAILQGLKAPTDFTGMFVNIVVIGN